MLGSLLKQIAARLRGVPGRAGGPAGAPGADGTAVAVRQALDAGDARGRAGDRDGARAHYARALALDPANPDASYALAVLDAQDGAYGAARARLAALLAACPDHAAAWNALGNVNKLERRWEEAAACYRRAVEFDARLASALSNLGVCLRNQGREHEAIGYLARAAEIAPADTEVLFNYHLGLIDAGRVDEGERGLARVLERDPDHAEAHVALACQLLVAGRFEEGWREYEWRSRVETWERRNAEYPYPWWRGEALDGRRLLVRAEQGLGDQIMFASCLPEVMNRGALVTIECEPRLAALFRRSFPGALVWPQADGRTAEFPRNAAPPDLQVNLGSLPGLLRRAHGRFPAHDGYLRADPSKVQAWHERLASLGAGLKVGLSWRGGTWNTRNVSRSMPLRDLAPLLRHGSVAFVSLQYGECAAEIAALERDEGIRVHHWQDAIDDYDETAALLCALDLLISIQTAVVHLAGALGRPAWVMVPSRPEWRYLREGETMPWYPSVRLLRQPAAGGWGTVIADLMRRLEERVLLAPAPGRSGGQR